MNPHADIPKRSKRFVYLDRDISRLKQGRSRSNRRADRKVMRAVLQTENPSVDWVTLGMVDDLHNPKRKEGWAD